MSSHGWKDIANRHAFLWDIFVPCFQDLNNVNSVPSPQKSVVRIQSAPGSSWTEKKGFGRQNF